MSRKYYGVSGVNAYGVYNDYSKVLAAKEYIVKFNTRRFNEFEVAKEWAEDRFRNLQCNSSTDWMIDELVMLNWTYYKKRSRKIKVVPISRAEPEPMFWINPE